MVDVGGSNNLGHYLPDQSAVLRMAAIFMPVTGHLSCFMSDRCEIHWGFWLLVQAVETYLLKCNHILCT